MTIYIFIKFINQKHQSMRILCRNVDPLIIIKQGHVGHLAGQAGDTGNPAYRKRALTRPTFVGPFKTFFFNFLPPYGELGGEISTQCAGILDAPRANFFSKSAE